MSGVVWHATIDEGKWEAKVILHETNYRGILLVSDAESGCILHTEFVDVHDAALFGPDPGDVEHWQNRSALVVDEPDWRDTSWAVKRYLVQREMDGSWCLIAMYDEVGEAAVRVGNATTTGSDVRIWDTLNEVEVLTGEHNA